MRVAVVGAGLGGLAAALRLQGAGHDVVVLEQRAAPGGRASRIRDAGFTWDTGPSLLTMPWVLEELFACGGLDLWSELDMHRLDPLYRMRWAGDERTLDFTGDVARLREEIAKFSPRDAGALESYLAAVKPIYDEAILDAGRRAIGLADLARMLPAMVRTGAARSLWHLTAQHFRDERVREAFSFHSMFIGGDPFRVPAVYAALVHLQIAEGVWYCSGGVYALVEALARTLDVRCGGAVERIEHRGGRVRGVTLDDGSFIGADAVIHNGDVLRVDELAGLPAPRRRLTPTMSCFLLYLGSDRRWDELLHHTLFVGPGYREFIKDVTRRGRLPRSLSTYVHAPARTEPAMAVEGGDSLSVLMPVPNLRGDVDWAVEGDRLRDALLGDLESSYGMTGLRDSIVVEHRMTPVDFRDRLGAVDGNAFSVEPTLHQSAAFRRHNRDPRLHGLYHVGGGTHPGAGVPGVLLGAEITARLVADDDPAAAGQTRMRDRAAALA
jgi:phytoene desaturase